MNGELDELQTALGASEQLLRGGGRLAVVSFHSLEDRMVKRFLRAASGGQAATSRHMPERLDDFLPTFEKPDKPVKPLQGELDLNPRSRSAILRAATRTEAPARTQVGVPA